MNVESVLMAIFLLALMSIFIGITLKMKVEYIEKNGKKRGKK